MKIIKMFFWCSVIVIYLKHVMLLWGSNETPNASCCVFRFVSWAEYGEDEAVDVHGHGGRDEGDLVRHHAAGAADRCGRCGGFRHWRYGSALPFLSLRVMSNVVIYVLGCCVLTGTLKTNLSSTVYVNVCVQPHILTRVFMWISSCSD